MSGRSITLTLALAAWLSASGAMHAAAFPIELHPIPATTGSGTEEVIGGDDIASLSLSPDGATIVSWDRSGDGAVCTMSTIPRTDPDCVPFADPIAFDSIRWSPDGTRFVFTEDASHLIVESDIHVFDTVSGEMTNLTDDGATGDLFDQEGRVAVDITPAWSPDGTEIVFSRSFWEDDGGVAENALYRVPADGRGPAEEIAVVSGTWM